MKFKDLIPLSDYVLGNWKKYVDLVDDQCKHNAESLSDIIKYTEFLKQPLKLSMFIPCVDEKPLEKPSNFDIWKNTNHYGSIEIQQYQKALDNVIFEGFEYVKPSGSYNHYMKINDSHPFEINFLSGTIEDLVHLNIKAKY